MTSKAIAANDPRGVFHEKMVLVLIKGNEMRFLAMLALFCAVGVMGCGEAEKPTEPTTPPAAGSAGGPGAVPPGKDMPGDTTTTTTEEDGDTTTTTTEEDGDTTTTTEEDGDTTTTTEEDAPPAEGEETAE